MIYLSWILLGLGLCSGMMAALSIPLSSVHRQFVILVSSTLLTVGELTLPANAQTLNSDEKVLRLGKDTSKLGLKLKEISYRGSVRVGVVDIQEDAPAAVADNVQSGAILTEIDGNNVEGLRLSKIGKCLKEKVDSQENFYIKFRDPAVFIRQLDSRREDAPRLISSLVLPKGTGRSRDQVLAIERLEPGKKDDKVLQIGDVGEISFQLRVKDTGEIVDGVEKIEAAGSNYGGSKNMFFVVGSTKSPDNPLLGKDDKSEKDDILPPNWDLSLRGMAVDEMRKISIPPVLRGAGYSPRKSLADALSSRMLLQGDLRGGNLVAKRAEGSAEDSLKWVAANKDSDLELTVRLLSINGDR